MEILKQGQEVITRIGNYKAIITAVTIRFEKVQYEVSYFHDGDYKTAWLDEREFTIENPEKITLGFRK